MTLFRKNLLTSLLLGVSLFGNGCGGGSGSGSDGSKSATDELFIGDGNGSVALSWNEPSTREDGSVIGGDLGYRLHYVEPNQQPQSLGVGQINNVMLHGLRSTTYSFAVSSVDSSGNESGPSEWISVAVP